MRNERVIDTNLSRFNMHHEDKINSEEIEIKKNKLLIPLIIFFRYYYTHKFYK